MNARMKNAYRCYNRSYNYTLYDVYGRFSEAKAEAFNYCKNLMKSKNGYGLKIISANGFQFTAGFLYEEDNKPMFAYITKASDTFAEIN